MPKSKELKKFGSEPKHDNPNHAGMCCHRRRSESAKLECYDYTIEHLVPITLLYTGTKGEQRVKRKINRSPKNPN